MTAEIKWFLIRFTATIFYSALFGIAMVILVPRLIDAIMKKNKKTMRLYFSLLGFGIYMFFIGIK